MKDKKYKYVEDVIEDYLRLTDEQIEIPLLISQTKEKYETLIAGVNGNVLKKGELDNVFKLYNGIKKSEERKEEIGAELAEVEGNLKGFLRFLNGKQIAYEKKDDVEKLKITYLFWLEDDTIKSNR